MQKANIGARATFYAARQLERASGLLRGKGFGGFTVDREVLSAIKLLGDNPKLVLDIGGNVGDYAAAMRRHAPSCDIVVFEPAQINVESLTRRFADDALTSIVAAAVSDADGSATLYSDRHGSGAASLLKRRLDHIDESFDCHESVSTISLDRHWRDVLHGAPIDILKLDIEGHEFRVLEGAPETVSSSRIVQLEFGGCNIDSRTFFQDFFYFFDDSGFNLHRITPLGLEPVARYAEELETFITTNYLAVRRGH